MHALLTVQGVFSQGGQKMTRFDSSAMRKAIGRNSPPSRMQTVISETDFNHHPRNLRAGRRLPSMPSPLALFFLRTFELAGADGKTSFQFFLREVSGVLLFILFHLLLKLDLTLSGLERIGLL